MPVQFGLSKEDMKTVINSLKRWMFREKPLRIQIPPRTAELTLNQWRQNIDLTSRFSALQQQELWRLATHCLQVEHPCHTVFSQLGVNPNDRVVQQAKIEGYELCLNNLRAMGQHAKPKPTLQARFEPEQAKK